jgi:hypothetical protein
MKGAEQQGLKQDE